MAAKETLVGAVRSIRGWNPVRERPHTSGRKLVRGRIPAPRDWAIWELPRWVIGFVGLVVLADAVVLAVEAGQVSIHLHDLALFAGLLICSAATVELTRRVGENLGFVKDVYAVWAWHAGASQGRETGRSGNFPAGWPASSSWSC